MSLSSADFDILHIEKRAPIQLLPPSASKLSELKDVELIDLQDGQVLKYIAETQKWKNVDIQAVVSNVVEGTTVKQGTGYSTVFQIAHGFGSTPTNVFIEGTSPEANEDFVMTWDDTFITITYEFPPPNTGTNNLTYYFRVS